jgi:DNA polymerase-1
VHRPVPPMLIFDIETNGLFHELDRVICMVIKDATTGEVTRYNDENNGRRPIEEGVRRLMEAQAQGVVLCGHNVIDFDFPALRKVYPWFREVPHLVLDTMVLARLTYPDTWEIDAKLRAQGKLPGNLAGRHSLEAWGHRLGSYKGDFKGPWDFWSAAMEDYNEQDVIVTHALVDRLLASKLRPDDIAITLEHAVARIIARQKAYGFLFDKAKAEALYVTLAKKRVELEGKLQGIFQPFYLMEKVKTPKRDNRTLGYVKDAPFTSVKLTLFNPGSRHHIANRLKARYGWKPTQFTTTGEPQIDEGVLRSMPYPEAKALEEYFVVNKRIGQIAEGKEAWLKHVKADGRIHGSVNTNGAVTGRMTHAYPNVAQTPAVYSPYGTECRSCFTAPPGKVLVGADAAALEARCLASFMARYDNGEYILTVTAGRKEDGTDLHSVTMRAIGITSRDDAKTWYYAFLYGGGDEKLGSIITKVRAPAKNRKRGAQSRAEFVKALVAIGLLGDAVKDTAKKRKGYIKGLDGRWLRIRAEHSALNTLLQSAGAVLMKRALVILDDQLQKEGYVPGVNYEFVANIHDEWQIECRRMHR